MTRLGSAYWRLWWANAVSYAGDGALVSALPLFAVTVTKDPRLISVVSAAPDQPEIDPAEAEEVRRLITMRLTAARRNNLPAVWTRRPGVVSCLVSDTRATPEPTDRAEPAPQAPHPPARPRLAWHE